MRDLVVIAMVIAGCVAALRRPWIGIMLWTWLSVMNPHRYTYGMALHAPLAAMAAVCVMLGLLMTSDRESPFKGSPTVLFVLFMCWITLSWLLGLDFSGDYDQWKKVMKIDVMLLVALMLLHSKQHIFALIWVSAGSLALLGIKGGIFTIQTGAAHRVWGPPGSFIEDNNEFALALVMTIPLLRFLQLQIQHRVGRHALTATMLLCTVSALGSHSRGALLGIGAMAMTLWWRGKDKLRIGIFFIIFAVPLVAFMPAEWTARMSTIQTYKEDGSAMGRINSWWAAWNMAKHYFSGVGFNQVTPELFARFSPDPSSVLAAHSIYFQVLGNHGFIGLFLFLGIWISTWRMASWLRTQKNLSPKTKWTADLGAMCQVSLIGYAVGGAFLSLAYFDLPYIVMAMTVLTCHWVKNKAWMTEPIFAPGWRTIPGLATSTGSSQA